MPKINRGLQTKQRKDRGTWEVGEYVGGKWQRLSRGFTSFGEAKDEEDKLSRQRRAGFIHELNERMVGDVLADYTEEKGNNIQAINTHANAVKELIGFFGGKPLSFISEASCNAYYAHRNREWHKRQKDDEKKDIKNSTVGRELRVLRAAINRDFDMGRITRKVKVFIKPERYREKIIITRKEALLIARRAKHKNNYKDLTRNFVLIALYTGARMNAIINLKWSQVDMDKGVIDFRPSRDTKNKRYPVVPIHRRLMTFLKILRKRGTPDGYVLHINQKPVVKVIKGFKVAAKRAKVDILGPYDLRHASIVHMLQNNISVYDVAKYHETSVEMIERNYGQYKPEHLKKASGAWG